MRRRTLLHSGDHDRQSRVGEGLQTLLYTGYTGCGQRLSALLLTAANSLTSHTTFARIACLACHLSLGSTRYTPAVKRTVMGVRASADTVWSMD